MLHLTMNLGQMVHGVSSALSNARCVKMVSSGDSPVGALKLTQEIMDISSRVPGLVKNLTGVDYMKVGMIALGNLVIFYLLFYSF